MKNTIIISILCLFIFSCSKDDESSKLFLDKYNGISWERLDETYGPTGSGFTFYKSPKGFSNFDFDIDLEDTFCSETTVFGIEDEFGVVNNIVEENENNIVIESIASEFEFYEVVVITVTTDGNLELSYDDGVYTYTRLATSPCN